MADALLQTQDLHAFYGESHVLHGVDLAVDSGEIVGLLGRNGAGRSTLAKAVMGLVAVTGAVRFAGHPISGLPTHAIAQFGIGYVPETRDVFPDLTVHENLLLGLQRRSRDPRWSVDEFLERFPNLAARRDAPAGALSGGEQQMLTLCRTLLGDPHLVLVDEPTEGLAPMLIEEIRQLLIDARNRGVSILLIEQKLSIALDICARFYVLGAGRIVFEGTQRDFIQAEEVRREWLGVG